MHQSWRTSVLHSHQELGLWMWECSTDHCWKQWHITNILSPTRAAIRWYVHTASRRPTMWQLFNRNTYSTAGHGCSLEWMLQTLFTSQSTRVTACRVKTEGAKTGLLSAIWLPMTMTNESLTLQSFSMHILCPGANEHSPRGCSFYLVVYIIFK